MKNRLRIGTWNVERSGALHRSRIAGQLDRMALQDCDIWILTETHDDLHPHGFEHHVSSCSGLSWQAPGERVVSIRSRLPLAKVGTQDSSCTAAVRVELPGLPRGLLVYGTVITYAHDTASIDGSAAVPAWSRHRADVAAPTQEWLQLSRDARSRGDYMCVAGDFNMNLDGTRWYGVNDARETLLAGLSAAGLRCLTTENLRQTRPDIGRASVDHICFSDQPEVHSSLTAWPGGMGKARLSDHNGMLVEISIE